MLLHHPGAFLVHMTEKEKEEKKKKTKKKKNEAEMTSEKNEVKKADVDKTEDLSKERDKGVVGECEGKGNPGDCKAREGGAM